jgi:hypothetical protein
MRALFLLNPHPRMPDMNLSRSEAADLAAYAPVVVEYCAAMGLATPHN